VVQHNVYNSSFELAHCLNVCLHLQVTVGKIIPYYAGPHVQASLNLGTTSKT
jgi:hypothetical protein